MLEKMSEADRRSAVCLMADSAGRVLARDFSSSTLADSTLLEKMSSAQVEALATVCRTKLAAGIEPTELEKQAFVGSLSGSMAVGKHMLRGISKGWRGGYSLPTKLRGAAGQGAAGRKAAVNVVERGEQAAAGSGISRGAWKAMPETGMSPGAAAAPRVAAKVAPKAAPAMAPATAPAVAAAAPTPVMQGTLGAAGRGAGWGGGAGAGAGALGGAGIGAASAEEGHRLRGALVGGALGAAGGGALGAGAGATLGAGRQMFRNVAGTAAKGTAAKGGQQAAQQGGQQVAQQGGQQVAQQGGQQAAKAVPQNLSTDVAGDVAKKGLSPMHYGLGALGLGAAGTGGYFATRGYLNRRQQLQQQLATQPRYS
jgi:hypothetical protein